jgi:transposase InsO family protein
MEQQLHYLIHNIRKDHPEMGVREIYFKMKPEGIGRDAFESFCSKQGYMCQRKKNFTRTTDSRGVERFPNQMAEMQHLVDSPNQLWQSDIFYIEIGDRFNYVTLIQDAFIKVILGHSASISLTTEATTLPALKMAIKRNKNYGLKGLVLHSDGGGQYYDKEFLKLTGRHKIINSMCEYPWDNGMAESLNNVIKNRYLKHRNIKSLNELQLELDRTVLLYNSEKPHSSLKRKTPLEFEKYWLNLLCQKNATETESFDAEIGCMGHRTPFIRAKKMLKIGM